ncbi:MAG: hypothetical protein WEB53_09905 [Akkermansiaceae bacterium]
MHTLAEPDFQRLSAAYGVCPRTVRRWHLEGVDVLDTVAVGLQLAGSNKPSPAALASTAELLKSELSNANATNS